MLNFSPRGTIPSWWGRFSTEHIHQIPKHEQHSSRTESTTFHVVFTRQWIVIDQDPWLPAKVPILRPVASILVLDKFNSYYIYGTSFAVLFCYPHFSWLSSRVSFDPGSLFRVLHGSIHVCKRWEYPAGDLGQAEKRDRLIDVLHIECALRDIEIQEHHKLVLECSLGFSMPFPCSAGLGSQPLQLQQETGFLQKHKVLARLLPSGAERNVSMPANANQTQTVQQPVKAAVRQPHLPHLPAAS